MTLPNIESSETPQENESREVQETVESPEVREEAQQLEQATFEPETVVEMERTHEEAEVVEATFTEVMQDAEPSTGEGGRPDDAVEATPIVIPNPVEEAAVLPIPFPNPQNETGDSAAIIDSNDGPRTKENETILQPTEGKYFDTAESGMESANDEVVLRPSEGKFFDTAETGMESARGEAILEPTEGKHFDTVETGMETTRDRVILEPTEGKPIPAMETTMDEDILGATEGKFFDTAESSVETAREESILGATEGKFFDTAEPGMETARDEAILQPTEGKYFDSPTAADERVMIDTVSLLESPGSAAFETMEGDPDAIGTWPTPERTADGTEIDLDQVIEDPDALPQTEELLPPQDGMDQDMPANALEDGEAELKKAEGDEGESFLPSDWHLYTDKDGNDIIVDGNGKPVDSPPAVYEYNGKKYLAYPGDAPAVDGKGAVKNPENLIEAPPAYKADITDMFIHEGTDGKLTVVDKNGKPVDCPPEIVEYSHKEGEPAVKYLAYPDTHLHFNEKGQEMAVVKANPAQEYKVEIEGMYIHEGTDGKLTVVDKNGKPVDSPPKIVEYYPNEGEAPVKYLAYPGAKAPFDESGKPLPGAKLNPAQEYNAEIKNMFIHEGTDGKLTVVDKNGKPVDSPPKIVEYYPNEGETAVKYLAYPGTKAPFDELGKPQPGAKLNPAQEYSAEIKDMYIHEGPDGKVTVVDKNGKPVDSPPIVMEHDPNNDGQTIKYLAYPDTKPPFDQTGKPTGVKFNPAQHYQGSTDGLYMHEGEGGKITVVDEKGQPIDSPPDIVMVNGKYYMAYPGTKEAAAVKYDGTIDTKDAKEITYYTPDWWTKNVKQETLKGT